jgi:hypothetical protein
VIRWDLFCTRSITAIHTSTCPDQVQIGFKMKLAISDGVE